MKKCAHFAVQGKRCCRCRTRMSKSYGRAFTYLAIDLRLSDEALKYMKQQRSEICFRKKKLHLVLDLDHTLIHARLVSYLTNAEKYLIDEVGSRNDLWRFVYEKGSFDYLIKLRPFVHEFLRQASELFSMYVYTKSGSDYAEFVLKLMDPLKIHFGHRVITNRDGPSNKTLDLVLAEEQDVVIVDDSPDTWPDHKKNLVRIKSYDYFKRGRDNNGDLIKSYSEEKTDESETDGPLAEVLRFLEEVHKEFYKNGLEVNFDSRDVSPLISSRHF